MEIIRKKTNIELSSKKFTNKDNICFFDIETTGFSRKYNYVYLVGVLYYENQFWKSKQFWLNSKNHEKKLLKHSIAFLNQFDKIINYNGDSFDISFLNERCKYHNLNIKLESKRSYDIYAILRKNKNFLNLPNLKLETVEESIGIYRKDQLSGKDCINKYKNYINTGDILNKHKILLHNYEDLIYLSRILKIIDKLKERKTIEIKDSLKFIISEIKPSNNTISVSGIIQNYKGIDIEEYNNYYHLSINESSFKIKFNFLEGMASEDSLAGFVNVKDFFNLETSYLLKSYKSFNIPLPIFIIHYKKNIVLTNIKLLIKSILIKALKN